MPTCYKNPKNPFCIDLFITNKNLYFQDTNAFETGLSDFRKQVVTVMKAYFRKMKLKTIRYRSYTNFDNYAFTATLLSKLMRGDSN